MSSDLIMFENSLFFDPYPSTDFARYTTFLNSLDSPIFSTTIDDHHHLNEIFKINSSFDEINTTLIHENTSFDQMECQQLENLSLCKTSHLPNSSQVKTEECFVSFETNHGYISNSFVNHGCRGLHTVENAAVKLMQRSFSSNSFDNNKPNFLLQPCFDSLLASPNFQSQVVSSPESSFSPTQMRRVCSTGDLHRMRKIPARKILSSSPLSTERTEILEDASNMKAGRYSVEERKERIDRYRAKRTQRNFNKTIKYACRKTLADNRQRVRGRFARNDEAMETPKTAIIFNSCTTFEDDDQDLWVDGLHEEDHQHYRI